VVALSELVVALWRLLLCLRKVSNDPYMECAARTIAWSLRVQELIVKDNDAFATFA
jgi:uncharacterized protein (UPF0147 family)